MGTIYKVILTPKAQADIQDIFNYLWDNVSLESANYVKDGIATEIAGLSEMPESKGLLRLTKSKMVYRRVLKWSYRIIFTIEEEKSQVVVVRVDHSKRNPEHLKDLP